MKTNDDIAGDGPQLPSRSGLRIGLLLLALVNMLPVAMPGMKSEAAWGIFAIAVFAAVLSCIVCKPSGKKHTPRWLIHLCVLAAVAYLAYEMFVPQAEQTVYLFDLGHFLILLCCCKFFEMRSDRDVGLVFLIVFLLLVVGAFISANILFGIVVAIDVTFGVGWFMAFQVQCGVNRVAERRRETLTDAELGVLSPDFGRIRRPRQGGLRTTAAYSLGLLTIAALTFVVIPRGWGRDIFGGIQQIMPGSVTGLADEVRLDDTAIFEDTAPAIRARFFQGGNLITSEDFRPYLRGKTFDRYSQGRWQRTPTRFLSGFMPGSLESPVTLTLALDLFQSEQIIEQHIWQEDVRNGVLFSMYPPLTLGSVDLGAIIQDRRDLAIRSQDPPRNRVHYVVHSSLEMRPPLTQVRWQVPRDGPLHVTARVRAFARDFTARFGDPADPFPQRYLAQRIRDYLQSDEFEYTLSRGESGGDVDPIEDFLFVNKRGHCEYFASAMTLLCQAVGIRARLVGGYYAGEFNPVGGFYQFRQKDAHAWVEIYQPRQGWITFDPSPASESRGTGTGDTLLAQAQRFIDYLGFKWATLVISFDEETRAELVSLVTHWFEELQAGFQGGEDEPRSLLRAALAILWGPDLFTWWQRGFYWLLLALWTALAVLAIRVLWILSLMLREYVSTNGRLGVRLIRRHEARFYDRILLLLSNKGHVKPKHLTPREFALQLAHSHADLSDLPEFTDWFYQAQYGHRRLDKHRWERLKAFLRSLREDTSFGAR